MSRQLNIKPSKSISRIDQPKKRMFGWYVRVCFNKKIYAKFFSDKKFGDAEAAYAEAVLWRNNKERELGKPRTERIVVATHPKNDTGVIGVRRTQKQTGAFSEDGTPYYTDVYEVTWSPEPKVIRRTSVSIEKYGEEEAFQRACQIRREKEREMYGSQINAQPVQFVERADGVASDAV